MQKVYVLIGASGSGKSTLAKKLLAEEAARGEVGYMYSADLYPGLYDEGGRFHPELLGEAHKSCLSTFLVHLVHAGAGVTVGVVDNTNTTLVEVGPYVAAALARGTEVEVIHCTGMYQNVHGVSPRAVVAMRDRIATLKSQWPAWWPAWKEM